MNLQVDWLRLPALAASMAFFLAGPVLADSLPQTAPRSAEVADFRLDNGMEIVVIPDRRGPIGTHIVWY